ncbi:MAG: hypothetical protein QM645_10795 [Asticcacaulis sp.]
MFNLSEQLSDLRDSLITVALLVAAAVIGLGWASIGLFNALKMWLGPVWGPVALGAVMIVPLIIYVIIKHVTKKEKKRQQAFMNQQTQAAYAQSSVVHISRIIDALKGQSPILASVAAVVAGIMATRFPSLLVIISEAVSAWAEDRARKRND